VYLVCVRHRGEVQNNELPIYWKTEVTVGLKPACGICVGSHKTGSKTPDCWAKKHAKASYSASLLNKRGDATAKWEVKYVEVMLTGHSKVKGHFCNLNCQMIPPAVLVRNVMKWC
jgi:hypothetical protein